jgi:hypothetical protein
MTQSGYLITAVRLGEYQLLPSQYLLPYHSPIIYLTFEPDGVGSLAKMHSPAVPESVRP